jgi:hypothetical protein
MAAIALILGSFALVAFLRSPIGNHPIMHTRQHFRAS